MKKGRYRIELHNMGGIFKNVTVKGTRIQVRAKCRMLQDLHDCGTRIHFIQYVDW